MMLMTTNMQQAVSNQMRALADEFDVAAAEKRKYQDAARRFRLPFWDPFMPRNAPGSSSDPDNMNEIWGLPKILSVEKVWVRKPKNPNDLTEIFNPLASFAFPSDTEYKEAEAKMKRTKLDWRLRGAKAQPKVSIFSRCLVLRKYSR